MAKATDASSKRKAAKKRARKASKRGGAKKGRPQMLDAAAAAAPQACLSLTTAAFIVGGCLPSGSHGNDDTLEKTGLITDNLRLIFRECVFNGVRATGCEINRGQIPNSADTKVGAVISAVFRNSR